MYWTNVGSAYKLGIVQIVSLKVQAYRQDRKSITMRWLVVSH